MRSRPIRRRLRRFPALIAVLALLVSQLALSVHACGVAMQMSLAQAHAAMPADCDEPMPSPNVCVQHCAYGESAVDAAKPLPAVDVTAGPALQVRAPLVIEVHRSLAQRQPPPPPQPPPAIRFSVLRI